MDMIVPYSLTQCACDFTSDFPAITCPPDRVPGIYAIVNRINQHVYVGSAKSLIHRKQHHLRDLKAGTHKNHHVQNAYDCYGPDAFLFGILEHVEHVENLLAREQYYIDTINPEYNIARTAGSNLGVAFTPEHRAKISAKRLAHTNMPEQMEKLNADRRGKHLSPEHRAKITANQTGRKLSPETRAKISAAYMGRKNTPEHTANIRAAKLGKPRSPETIAKVSAAKRGTKQSPEIIEKRIAPLRGKKRPPEVGAKVSATKRAQKLAKQQANQPPLF